MPMMAILGFLYDLEFGTQSSGLRVLNSGRLGLGGLRGDELLHNYSAKDICTSCNVTASHCSTAIFITSRAYIQHANRSNSTPRGIASLPFAISALNLALFLLFLLFSMGWGTVLSFKLCRRELDPKP